MKVTFVLPDYSLSPVGGFRIVYTYANALAKMGHEVTLIFPNLARHNALSWVVRVQVLRRVLPPWYDIEQRVSCRFRWAPTPRDIPDGDAVIATGVQTADFVADLPQNKGVKFYLVQHLEDWIVSADTVRGTWRLPIDKLAISKWLYDEIMDADPAGRVRYLPNPFDLRTFYVTVAPESRDAYHVAMMWSLEEFKRAPDGLAALKRAHVEIPELRATFFGTVRAPAGLPRWIKYVHSPHGNALRELYNQNSIFLHTSSSEGFGLPPGEAMACGSAVVATRNRGVLEYLHEDNAVLVDVGDVDGLAAGITSLVRDRALRMRLVDAGMATVRSQSTDDSARRLEGFLLTPEVGCQGATSDPDQTEHRQTIHDEQLEGRHRRSTRGVPLFTSVAVPKLLATIQVARRCRNWPQVTAAIAGGHLPKAGRLLPQDLTFRCRTGPTLRTARAPSSYLPVLEVVVDDAYHLSRLPWTGNPNAPIRVLDVGAHVGAFAVTLAARYPRARVACFEPSPEAGEYLAANIAANDLSDRVNWHGAAVGPHVGTARLLREVAGSCGSTLLPELAPEATSAIDVEVVDLATAIAASGGPQLVKLDCEGGEYGIILDSDPALWESVRCVLLEYHPVRNHSWAELQTRFARLGFRTSWHDPDETPGLGMAMLIREPHTRGLGVGQQESRQ